MGINQPTNNAWDSNDYVKLALSFFPAAIITWGLHEGAHWLMGRLLGYDMWISFNQVGPVQGSFDVTAHQMLVTLFGPIVTLIQALFILFVIQKTQQRRLWIYSLLFLPFWTRALAMIISFVSNPNDEANLSLLLGLPLWVVPIISVSLFLFILYRGYQILKPGWRSNVIGYVMASIVTGMVIYLDQLLF